MPTTEPRPIRALLAGESWVTGGVHVKGSNVFTQPRYEEGAAEFVCALQKSGIQITRIPAHSVSQRFPRSVEQLNVFDVVIISDVGADSFELTDECLQGNPGASPLAALRDWVADGGSLLMIGGYMSFSGIQAQARYGRSRLSEVLPVLVSDYDDRIERPDGVEPTVVRPDNDLVAGLPKKWPPILGYNRVAPKSDADVIVKVDEDPLVVLGRFERGLAAAFTSDCAPHWASRPFLDWDGYDLFFGGLCKRLGSHGL